jgi:hypothetical protein
VSSWARLLTVLAIELLLDSVPQPGWKPARRTALGAPPASTAA